ncbi:helix-turn-helix domain-containing protein [Dyella psychrodurans]|nr:AraC family transcriptional regulator [Dyella psychrodurans]
MKEGGSGYPRRQVGGLQAESGDTAFGKHLAGCFGVPEPDLRAERKLERGTISLSELKLDRPMAEPSGSLGCDEAFLVDVQLASIVGHEYWLNGRSIPVEPAVAGMTYIHDLRLDPRAMVRESTHSLHFRIPLATLNAFSEQNGTSPISELIHGPMVGRDDPVMRFLCQAALVALREQHIASGLLLDEILSAVCAHTLGNYGNASAAARRYSSGLARWQELRAKEMMDERMDISLAELALECKLSVTHFARSFRRSTGVSPHQWLLARRVNKAKFLLVESDHSMAHIALECGFSSQSHFNAAFKQCTKMSPGRWRRSFAPWIDSPSE